MGLELINLRFKCNKAFAESCYFPMLPREEHSYSILNQGRKCWGRTIFEPASDGKNSFMKLQNFFCLYSFLWVCKVLLLEYLQNYVVLVDFH